MALPSTRVEIAWDSGFATAEGSRTWTDVSAYVEGNAAIGDSYGRADELSAADPNTLSVTLDNRDGRFTPGKSSSPYYPNVKKGKPIRMSVRYLEDGAGNFLSANQASMETSVADWSAGGTVLPTLAQSATHADVGSNALRITWGTGGTSPRAQTTVTGLVVGRTYTAQARVWVTSGTPDVRLGVSGLSNGTATSTKSAFTAISYTFVATASSHILQVQPATAPTSGQQCWVDSVMVDEGSAVGTFTTTAPPIYTRFTGYVNEWPLVWPDGTDKVSAMTITASSRRARMGQSAPLTSAIRAAYMADNPVSYWPMDEDVDFSVVLSNGVVQQLYRDLTNTAQIRANNSLIGSWFESSAFAPVVRDGLPGPTDEQSLVKVPRTTDVANPDWRHYVGGSGVTRFGTSLSPSSGCTFEMLARVAPTATGAVDIDLARIFVGNSYTDEVKFGLFDDGSEGFMYCGVRSRDDAGTITEDAAWGPATTLAENRAAFARACDGEIHHYSIDITDNGALLYFDGEWVAYTIFASSIFTKPFRTVTMCSRTLFADVWIGHAATYDTALGLSGANLLHAAAATSNSENIEERVERVAGRVGVPADEIDVEASVGAPLGSQPEAGRSASEVLNEIGASTGGVVYDTRAGHLALQARNHRYNQTAAFTLSAATQEVGSDLTVILDDRYLVNTVQFSRTGTAADTDAAATISDSGSIDDYGVYSTTLTIVSTSDQEVAGAAADKIFRFAQPAPRVSQITVDLGNLSDSQRRLLLAADIGTLFTLSGLPSQAQGSTMALYFEGATETITATSHTMTINTTPGDLYTNVAILNDAAHDVLGSGIVLAY